MNSKLPSRFQFFFWHCAAVDPEVMLDERTPGIDRIRFSIVGALICTTSAVASIGWMYELSLILLENPYRIPLSILLGIGMGVLFFRCEQVLIAFIPVKIVGWQRIFAFSWRLALAGFNAAIMALPFSLNYFHNEIAGQLYDKKLSLMAEKRKEVDKIFDLSTLGISIENTGRAIAQNLAAENTLPPYVAELTARSAACDRERQRLRRSIAPKLQRAVTERKEIIRQLEGDQLDYDAALKRRLAELNGLVATWSRTLGAKAQACAAVAQRANNARQRYFADLEEERQVLKKHRTDYEASLESAEKEANPVLEQADESIRQRTTPDLSAQAQALYELAAKNSFILAVVEAFYGVFLMIELLPIIAKLTSRSIYERILAATEDKICAVIDADVAVATAQTQIKKAEALAEVAGTQRYYMETAGTVFSEMASTRAALERDKKEILAPFEHVLAVIAAYDTAQGSVDRMENRLAKIPRMQANIQRVRRLLGSAMTRAVELMRARYRSSARVVKLRTLPRRMGTDTER